MDSQHRFFVIPEDEKECNHIECDRCSYAHLVEDINKCFNKERRQQLYFWN